MYGNLKSSHVGFLNNKRTLWSNYFDIRNSERYESPSNFFINDETKKEEKYLKDDG